MRQYSIINKTVERKNLNLLKTFEVVDVSGTEVLRCPEVLELLNLVETRQVQGICIADLDRLFRPDKPSDYAILGVFQTTGAVIYCGDSELDLSTKNGMLFGQIRSAISGFELSIMKERQEGGKHEKRLRGKCPTPLITMPTGTRFDRVLDKWVYTPEIAIVRELFRLFDEENLHNYSELSRRTGINHATIRIILKNPIYTGWRVFYQKRGDKRTSKSGKTYRVKIKRAEEDIIRVKVFDDPAIPQEVFDRVQAQMAKTTFNHNERFRKNNQINLGAGIAFCGHCTERMYYTSCKKNGSGGYAGCNTNNPNHKARLGGCKQKTHRKLDLDNALVKLGVKVLADAANLAEIITASIVRQRTLIRPLTAPVSQSAMAGELSKRDGRLLQAFEAGAISVEELRERRAALRRQLEQLNTDQTSTNNPGNAGILDTARIIVKSGLRFGEINDAQQQKAALRNVLSKVIVRDLCITSFEFNARILPAGSHLIGHQIMLDPPICIAEAPEELPPGSLRCIRCREIKELSADFYRKRNICKPCLSEQARVRYQTTRKFKSKNKPS